MYNGVGLPTSRGSGSNGYTQANKFLAKPKNISAMAKAGEDGRLGGGGGGVSEKKPNKDILEHQRKRLIELKLVQLQDKLVDHGYTDAEIAERLAEARKNLEATASFALSDKKEIDSANGF